MNHMPWTLALVVVFVVVPQWSQAERGAPGAESGSSPTAERERRALLRRLRIDEVPASRKEMKKLSHLKWVPERPAGRGLAASIEILKKWPFTWRPVQYGRGTRDAVTRMAIDSSYNPLKDSRVRLSHEKRYQRRAHSMFWQISSRFNRELGLNPKPRVKNVVVVEGGNADSLNAVTFWNGSIIMHKELMDTADRVGTAVVAARSPAEMISNLQAVAAGTFSSPRDVDPKAARAVADSFVATVVGHEMGHALKRHGPTGRPRGKSLPMLNIGSRSQRARETVCDGAGTDLAMRVGYSPLGVAAVPLYFAMYEANLGFAEHSQGSHPAGIDRYRFIYRYMDSRQGKKRRLYSSERRLRDGPDYMTPEMRRSFGMLPTPPEVMQAAQRIAEEARAARQAGQVAPAAGQSFYPVF